MRSYRVVLLAAVIAMFGSYALASAIYGTPFAVLLGGTGATTAAGARSNLQAAQLGANADITSLSGLTTPLSCAQGGTGLTSFTSGGFPAATGATTLASTGVMALNDLIIGGGAGAVPTDSGIPILTPITDSGGTGNTICIGPGDCTEIPLLASAAYASIVIGKNSLKSASLTSAALANVAIGNSTLDNNTSGTKNMAFGNLAGHAITSGGNNLVWGNSAMAGGGSITGSTNIVIGNNSVGVNGASAYANNTIIGHNSATSGTFSGSSNVYIGNSVAQTNGTSGSSNVVIAPFADLPAAGASKWINIGNGLECDATAPTVASGFGSGASIPHNAGNCAFTVNVGTGGSATNGVINFTNAAPHGWACTASDSTTTSATVFITKSAPTSTTSVTLTNYNTSASAAAWAASDVLEVKCLAY